MPRWPFDMWRLSAESALLQTGSRRLPVGRLAWAPINDQDAVLPHRQTEAAGQPGKDRLRARKLRCQGAAGAQVFRHLVGVRPDAAVHGRHHFVVALRAQARPAEVRRRDPRLQRGLGRRRDRRDGRQLRQDHLQLHRPAAALRGADRGHHPWSARQPAGEQLRLSAGRSGASVQPPGRARPGEDRAGDRQDQRFHVPQQLRERSLRSVRRNADPHRGTLRPSDRAGRVGQPGWRHPLHRPGLPDRCLLRAAQGFLREVRRAGLPGARRGGDHPERLAGGDGARHPLQRQEPGGGRQLHRSAHARSADLPPQRQDGAQRRRAHLDGVRQILSGRRHFRRVPIRSSAGHRRSSVVHRRSGLHHGQEKLVQRPENAVHRGEAARRQRRGGSRVHF